jgi:outer membrane translocation and assembly module TamA
MKKTTSLTILLLLFCPVRMAAARQKQDANVNSRFNVESVVLSGVAETKVSKTLRDDMQKLVGEKYNEEAANELAKRLRKELRDYSVDVKVKRGDKPEQVKVIFEVEQIRYKRFEIPLPPVVYHSKEGFSGSLEIPIKIRHSVFAFGMLNNSDEFLERNAGFNFRFEQRKLGTEMLQLRLDFETYHQTFNHATEEALAQTPEVPGIYRWRQNFAPSLSLIPHRDVKLRIGTSFQQFQTQYPVTRTETAYAGTADLQYRHRVQGRGGIRQDLSADYGLRTATRILDSDFVYTRHFATVDYRFTRHRNSFGAHFRGGLIAGTAPLFERFSLGNSFTLRGWNKFDVAPLGGSRVAHGSLDYRYRPFEVFYDFGAVWDKGQTAQVRHGLGFGLVTRDGFFASLAFPVRLHDVAPVFMIGFRYWGAR